MSSSQLPAVPNLEHLKNQAHDLLSDKTPAAAARFAAQSVTQPKLADALHVIAREYGFATWPALKLHVESMSEDPITALAAAMKGDDAQALVEVLAKYPGLKSAINEPLPNSGFQEPALLAAVHKQNRAMVDALLDFGANVNERSRWWAGSFGVLDFARPELAEHLIARGARLDLHSAARLGKAEVVRAMLAADPTLVRARGGDGQLALHFAATIEIAEMLLEAGAELEAKDIDHESTALQHMASSKPERHDVARYLLAKGAKADILAASALGELALVESLLNEDPENIRVSVTERSFPKQNPRSGGTIYMFGFGPTATAHMLARRYGHEDVLALLMQRSAPSQRLSQAAEFDDEELIQKLLVRHPDVITKLNPLAAWRLIGPAVRNNTRAVELMLKYGWPAQVVMDNGQTPLHFAAWNGNAAMVEDLLAHGADATSVEQEHDSGPLGWALWGSLYGPSKDEGDFGAVVRALQGAGAVKPGVEGLQGSAEAIAALV